VRRRLASSSPSGFIASSSTYGAAGAALPSVGLDLKTASSTRLGLQ
jgi:hypothetical protein